MKLKERLTEWWPVICMLSLYTSNFHILISMSNDLVSWKKSPQTSNEMRYGNWLVSSEPCTTNTMNNICFYPPDTEWLMEGKKTVLDHPFPYLIMEILLKGVAGAHQQPRPHQFLCLLCSRHQFLCLSCSQLETYYSGL